MFVRDVQGAVSVLAPTTPLVGDVVDEFFAAVRGALRPGRPMLVLDLQQVPHVDSAGLEALLDVQDELRARGGEVKLAALPPVVRDALRATRLIQQFQVFGAAKAAVGSFAS
jgi:anti-sigma B factor antagonist